MAKWQQLLIGGSLGVLGIIAGLCLTNPQRAAYEDYVVDRIGQWAQQECGKASENAIGALANLTCRTLVSAGQPYLRDTIQPIIAGNTTYQNFGVASFYTTTVFVPQLNLDGRIETIGIFGRFFTYRMP